MMISPISAADLRWSAPSSPCSGRLSIGLLRGLLFDDNSPGRRRSQPLLATAVHRSGTRRLRARSALRY
jgi:hypothetical protein